MKDVDIPADKATSEEFADALQILDRMTDGFISTADKENQSSA